MSRAREESTREQMADAIRKLLDAWVDNPDHVFPIQPYGYREVNDDGAMIWTDDLLWQLAWKVQDGHIPLPE